MFVQCVMRNAVVLLLSDNDKRRVYGAFQIMGYCGQGKDILVENPGPPGLGLGMEPIPPSRKTPETLTSNVS